MDLPARPSVPSAVCKNNGSVQTITFSEPVEWVAGIWNWNWVNADAADESKTVWTLDQASNDRAYHAQQGYGTWSACWQVQRVDTDGNTYWGWDCVTGTYAMSYAYDVSTTDGLNVKYDNAGHAVVITQTLSGTNFFGNGESTETKIEWVFDGTCNGADNIQYIGNNSCTSVGGHGGHPGVWFVDAISETYADGTRAQGSFLRNIGGQMTHYTLFDADSNVVTDIGYVKNYVMEDDGSFTWDGTYVTYPRVDEDILNGGRTCEGAPRNN